MTSQELEHESESCLICCSDNLHNERGIVPCTHDSICGPCHARLRYLHSDLRCPVCKTSNDRIIVDADSNSEGPGHKKYEEYGIWGDELGQDFILREDVKMFFRKEYHDKDIAPLFELACYQKGCSFVSKKGMKILKDHLRGKHTLTFCNLCVEAKRDFVSKLPRFRPEQLKRHMAKGDGEDSGFKGHPLCEFCRPKRFYDLTKLHEHLNKEHYKCHVCERQGLHNQFFKNYDKLAIHFDKQHFLCHDPQCLAARFVVFDNEIDLRAHEISVHGSASSRNSSTKINLEFRVRRTGYDGSGYENQNVPTDDDFQFGLNGEAFVPESLPGAPGDRQQAQENEPEISDPVHAARTAEMRAQAAEIRRAQNLSEAKEEFPSLGTDGSGQPLVGWTAEGRRVIKNNGARGAVTEEAFPALQSSAKSKNKKISQLRPTVQRPPAKPYTNIIGSVTTTPSYTTASIQNTQSRSYANGSTSQNRASDLTADNFPSLGGSSSARTYTAAQNFAKTLQPAQTAPAAASSYNRTTTQMKKPASAQLRPPTAADFPSLGGSSTYAAAQNFAKMNLREKMMGKPKTNGTAAQVLSKNTLLPPTPASKMDPKEQLSAVKSILGPNNYKNLKKLTVQFASNKLAHEQYIDQVANVFPEGKKDDDFWNFVPALIESCPDEGDGRNSKALEYMACIRMAADLEDGYTPQSAYAQNVITNRSATISTNSSNTQPVLYSNFPTLPKKAQNTKNKWGSGSSAAATESIKGKSKLPPGTSVAKDAATEKVERGTATKFMAKMNADEKKMKHQTSQPTNAMSKKSKSKKKKNELRDLAFGK